MKDVPARKAGKRNKSHKKGSLRQPVADALAWITKADAARIRGVTRQAIGKLVKKGKLATLEIAGHTLVRRADVENYQPEPGGRPAGS